MPSAVHILEQQGIESNWSFMPSPVPLWRRRAVAETLLRRSIRSPAFQCIKPVTSRPRWALYFIFSLNGTLSPAHVFALTRLRDLGLSVLALVACTAPENIAAELHAYADAIYWKGPAGYDFSAYKIGLDRLAEKSAGCSVVVMNDSVIGPLNDTWLATRPAWSLTGFTASGKIENHIQSYAFCIECLTPKVMRQLRTVLFPLIACRDRDDVIGCQEIRFGRIAAKSMTVGAMWFMAAGDPTQTAPFELIDAGFPFIKKSLLEARSAYADKARVRAFIDDVLSA